MATMNTLTQGSELSSSQLGSKRTARIVTPALVGGFATAVGMWCVWFLGHLPALALPPQVNVPALLICMVVGMWLTGRSVGQETGWKVGGVAGILTSLINLLILGAHLAQPPQADKQPLPGFEGFTPSAALVGIGFLALGAVVGVVFGAIGSRGVAASVHEPRVWVARFAIVNVVAIVPLLLIGGSVTSTASGMAVPGWPSSYGANMFLYPITLMSQPRVFLEHTHRLFGSMVGLTTLVSMVLVLVFDRTRFVRVWAVVAFVLVLGQGYLGGQRVNSVSIKLAMVHGVAAQLFFAFVVALAAYLSVAYIKAARADAVDGDRKRKIFATGLLHATIVQLLLGATYRHFGQQTGQMHALWAHAAWSMVVVVFALLAGFTIRSRFSSDGLVPLFQRVGVGLIAVVGVQFMLGWWAFFVVVNAGPRGGAPLHDQLETAKPIDAMTALVATAHQANGALLLALATLAIVFTRRVWKANPTAVLATA